MKQAEYNRFLFYVDCRCGRCFGAYKAVIMCMNIRHCYIIKVRMLVDRSQGYKKFHAEFNCLAKTLLILNSTEH